MARESGESRGKLQAEETEVSILRDRLERLQTDNVQLKRKVDKQGSLLNTLEARVSTLEGLQDDGT